jgi:hypothetical protein
MTAASSDSGSDSRQSGARIVHANRKAHDDRLGAASAAFSTGERYHVQRVSLPRTAVRTAIRGAGLLLLFLTRVARFQAFADEPDPPQEIIDADRSLTEAGEQ